MADSDSGASTVVGLPISTDLVRGRNPSLFLSVDRLGLFPVSRDWPQLVLVYFCFFYSGDRKGPRPGKPIVALRRDQHMRCNCDHSPWQRIKENQLSCK